MTEVVGPPRRPWETVPTARGERVSEGSLSYGTESAKSDWAETDEFRGRCLFLLKMSMAVKVCPSSSLAQRTRPRIRLVTGNLNGLTSLQVRLVPMMFQLEIIKIHVNIPRGIVH